MLQTVMNVAGYQVVASETRIRGRTSHYWVFVRDGAGQLHPLADPWQDITGPQVRTDIRRQVRALIAGKHRSAVDTAPFIP